MKWSASNSWHGPANFTQASSKIFSPFALPPLAGLGANFSWGVFFFPPQAGLGAAAPREKPVRDVQWAFSAAAKLDLAVGE